MTSGAGFSLRGRDLQDSSGQSLPHGRGSVSYCKRANLMLSRTRKPAVVRILQVALKSAPRLRLALAAVLFLFVLGTLGVWIGDLTA